MNKIPHATIEGIYSIPNFIVENGYLKGLGGEI